MASKRLATGMYWKQRGLQHFLSDTRALGGVRAGSKSSLCSIKATAARLATAGSIIVRYQKRIIYRKTISSILWRVSLGFITTAGRNFNLCYRCNSSCAAPDGPWLTCRSLRNCVSDFLSHILGVLRLKYIRGMRKTTDLRNPNQVKLHNFKLPDDLRAT